MWPATIMGIEKAVPLIRIHSSFRQKKNSTNQIWKLKMDHAEAHLVVGIRLSDDCIDTFCRLLDYWGDLQKLSVVCLQDFDELSLTPWLDGVVQRTRQRIAIARNEMAIEPGLVYVCPPNHKVHVRGGTLWMDAIVEEGEGTDLVDYFFYSLAEDLGPHAVGIGLSGADLNLRLGLQTILDHGGLALTLNESLDRFESIDISSTDGDGSGTVGMKAPAIEFDRIFTALEASVREKSQKLQTDKIERAIPKIADLIQTATDHRFHDYKTSTFIRRIQRRMQLVRILDVDAYVVYLQERPEEIQLLFRDLLIGVTAFFRDAEAFASLQERVLKDLITKRGSNETIRMWVAGCSTGEEAYTLAMLCVEVLSALENPPTVQIFASDIDRRALAKARAGSYTRAIENHVSAERLNRFFKLRGDRYEVTSEIRSLVLFTIHNVISDPPFSRLDLISCRNLMIYLGEKSNEKLIPLLHHALNFGGYLMLGPSENIAAHETLFQTVDAKHRIAQRKEIANGFIKGLELGSGRLSQYLRNTQGYGESVNWSGIRNKILLDDFLPKSCIVDASGKILNASASIEKYLSLKEGDFRNDIIAMAASGLKIGLRSGLKEAKATCQKAQVDNLAIRVQDKWQRVMLTVLPLTQADDLHEVYMIVFQDIGPLYDREELESARFSNIPDADKVISHLEAELETHRKELDRSLQEMEATNEELKSSNEELLSMNEELHAANEELETSREEILQGRMASEQAHSDLQNLMRSTRIATLFLDNQLRICNFTPAISEIYELLSTDVGRPLDRFVPRVVDMPPLPDPQTVLSGSPIEHTVLADSGKSFIRRILPYETHNGTVAGIVVTFHDVTDLRASEAKFQSLVDASAQIVWIADAQGRAIADSPSWRDFTGQSLEQWMGRNGIEAIHPDDQEGILQRWDAAVQSGEPLNHEYRLWHRTGVWRWTQVRAVAQRNVDGSIYRWVGMNTDITERKRWEIELRDRESHLRRVIDNTLYFIGVLDLDGKLLEVNAAALLASGVRREDVIGQAFYDCYWWNYGDESVVKQLQQAIFRAKQGETIRYDVVVRMADDSRMTIDFMLSPVRDAEGQITHLIPSGVDISQRKQAEQALIERANQLDLALESGRMGMYEWEPDTDRVFWDKRHLALTGLPHTTMTGADFLKLVHPDDVDGNRIAIEKTMRGEADYDTEFRIIRTDGQVRWIAAHGKLVRFDDGRPMRFVGLNWDITERKQSETTIKLNEARLRNAAAVAGFAMLHADLVQGVVTFSAETNRLVGLPEDEPVIIPFGKLPDWIHPDDELICVAYTQKVVELKEGASLSLDHRILKKDGEMRWMRLHSKPIFTGEGEHRKATQLVGTLLDITQQHQFEESLNAARQLAEAANESKSLFLANMSHEIRTPMTAILGFAEVLEENDLLSDPAQTASAIQTIRTNANHLLAVINDILDMSKIEAGCMKVEEIEISPATLLSEIETLLGPRAKGKGLELRFAFDSLMPERIFSDPTRLRQILLNLIGNAIKFTEIGSVTVHTSFYAATNRIQFRVVDTGVGMTLKQLEVVSTFQAFSQADTSTTRQFGGTGLGLRISNTLAQLLGGFINVDSKLGKGSVFTVNIEAKVPQNAKSDEATENTQSMARLSPNAGEARPNIPQPLIGMKILIAEDGPDNQRLISFHLRKAGAVVSIVENGLLAAELIEQQGQCFDVLFMDMQMPVLDGYQTTRRLRTGGYTGVIIALTAHALETDRTKCLDAGCDAFATKPISRSELISLAEQYGRGKCSVPSVGRFC